MIHVCAPKSLGALSHINAHFCGNHRSDPPLWLVEFTVSVIYGREANVPISFFSPRRSVHFCEILNHRVPTSPLHPPSAQKQKNRGKPLFRARLVTSIFHGKHHIFHPLMETLIFNAQENGNRHCYSTFALFLLFFSIPR